MNKKTEPTGERLTDFFLHPITLEHLHRYAIATELVKGKSVLDIACGEGYGSDMLSGHAASVTGMDIDEETIEAAKKKYEKASLSFSTGNVENIPAADSTFDMVVSFETLEHITNHDKMLSEIKRVLKPGGVLLISTPDKLEYSEKPNHHNPFHKKELYKAEFEILLGNYFKNIQLLSQSSGLTSLIVPEVHTGSSNTFTSDFNNITSSIGLAAPFIIAVASDSILPVIPLSVFKSETLLAELLKEQHDALKESASYKVGHFLLKPFKLIRSALRKKSGAK